MVRYLKYIVLIFGTIGIIAASFFYMQNKVDISYALEYGDKLDYDYLVKECPDEYVYPCLKQVFEDYLSYVSLTGTSMGLKMAFTVMDEDKIHVKKFENDLHRDLQYSIHYIELNNFAIENPIKRYHGFTSLYGGYVATLTRHYEKAYAFTDNIIIGLEGPDGISKLEDEALAKDLSSQLALVKERYYLLKRQVEEHLDRELAKLNAKQ